MPGEKYNCVFMYILEFEKVRRFYIFLNTPIVFVNIQKKGILLIVFGKIVLIFFPLHPRENYLLYEVQNFECILLDTQSILHLFRSSTQCDVNGAFLTFHIRYLWTSSRMVVSKLYQGSLLVLNIGLTTLRSQRSGKTSQLSSLVNICRYIYY